MACGAKVSMGERVAAMILNGLGFMDSRLYLFPAIPAFSTCPHVDHRYVLNSLNERCIFKKTSF
jgi:hypothetical protein